MEIHGMSFDIEGCMTDPGTNIPWPTEKLQLLGKCFHAMQEAGIVPFLNTGRPAPFVEAMLMGMGFISRTPHLCENGAVLWYPQAARWEMNHFITEESLRQFQMAKGVAINYAIRFRGTAAAGKEASCTLYPSQVMKVDDFYHLIRVRLQNMQHYDRVEITHSAAAVDITPKGVTKASGLRALRERLGLYIAQVAGIGDSVGDIPVLQIVGMPMCPSNGSPEVKTLVNTRGGYVSDLPTIKGVADCIRHAIPVPKVQEFAEQIIRLP